MNYKQYDTGNSGHQNISRCSFHSAQVPQPGEPDLDPSTERTHVETFDFADLRFIKSSRMSKRWLVFALRIKVLAYKAICFVSQDCSCCFTRH